jgi:hypothetical protein
MLGWRLDQSIRSFLLIWPSSISGPKIPLDTSAAGMRPNGDEEREKIKIKETPLPWKQLSGHFFRMPLLSESAHL